MTAARRAGGADRPKGVVEGLLSHSLRAIDQGVDAVLLARVIDDALHVELANEAAHALFGLDDIVTPTELDASRMPALAPLVSRLREGAARGRATRERVALQPVDGDRVVVDIQIEPVPDAEHDAGARVLAVVRLVDREVPSAFTGPSVVGVFRTELGLGVVFVDDALLSLLGLTHEQALGQGWLEALHPDDRRRVGDALEPPAGRDEAVQLQCRVVRGGVDERVVRMRAVPVRGDEGGVTGYIGSLEDVSEEQCDAEVGADLAELADVLDEWIVILDADLRVRYVNPAAWRGLALEELDGSAELEFAQLIGPEGRAHFAGELTGALGEHNRWSGTLQLRARDDRSVELECTVTAHRGADGSPERYTLLGSDVSTLRVAERALRESEERFRLIADSSPTGIYFVRDSAVIAYANRRLADIFGELVETLIGRSFLEWVHPDDLARLADTGAATAAERRATKAEEYRIRRQSGEERWVCAQGAPVLDGEGKMVGYVGTVLDVTEERAAQRELVMLGRAVESTHELVTFHDHRGRIIFANAAAREFFGIGAGARVPPIGPSEFLENDAVVPEISNALHTKGEWSGELAVVGHRGRRVVLSIGLVAHFDRNGELEYYSALSTDLTEQRRSDAARRRSEAALRAVVQASPLPIIALDSRGTVHVWNRASEELFGWSAPEALGVPPPFVCDANREEFAALLDQVFGGKVVRGHRTRYARRDDVPLAVDIALAPVRDANDRVVTAVAVIADVSEQVRATEALAASEVWFRSLVQHSSDMVMVIGEDRKLAYASETACLFLGLDDAAVNRPVAEVVRVVEEDLEPLRSLFAELRERPGETRRARLRILDADEAARWIEITATNMLHDDAVRGVVVNGRDITESYEADAAVRDSEERLRALLSSVSDAITVLGADGSLLYSSPVADEILGDLPDESIFAPLDPGDVARAMEQWDQTLARPGMGPASEVHIRRGDGSWIDAEVIANNLLDDPAVGGIVLTIRDITERTRSEVALRRSESRLRESEARYRAVVDDQIELVCRYEPDTTITFANRAFAEFYGHRFDDLIGSKLIELHPLAMRSAELERLAGFGPGAEVQTYDDWELGADGVGRWYRWTDRAFLDEGGAVVEFQSVGHDVTEEHRSAVLTTNQADILEQVARGVPLEETLDAIARTLEAHFPRLMCAVFLADPDGSRLRVGAAPHVPRRFVAELDGMVVGASAGSCGAAALRREPVYVADATTDPLWASHHGVALEHGIRSAWSTPITGSDGGAVLGTLAVYANHRGEPDAEHRRIFSLIARLASIAIERKAFEERLAHESMHDPLTGLPNRVLFLDRLSLAVARGNRTRAGVAVLFLDLDRFKNVNDSLGHDAGDELLVGVAHRLESMLRPGDTVARFGGDEFTILCEDLPHESARERAIEIAQRLLASIERPFVVRNAETFVGISIGIALSSTGTETADELLRDADAAMYHAKDAGRGRAEVFDDTMRARVLARHATENALHRAIERGELRLFFQPIVSLRDARCTGAEALVRWQHPERGLVLPSEFVPLAEETGLIVPLGAWVLEQAAVQAARWQLQHDDDFVVSINLSARQVVEPDLADRVADVIARTGVRPSNLCFEITETVLMHDADAVMRVIERMRTLGVHFAIDDFGTGYSSLGYLKRFSVDTVKIDRAFVDGIADDDGDRAIVSAVIGLAHELALYVVAEGVEREQQLTELVALGCDGAQGYFFAPPQPADDLRQLVSRTRRWRPPGTPLMGRPTAPPGGRTPRASGGSKPDETQL